MGKQHINITQSFNAPVDTIFNIITDHEAFGHVINTKTKRVVDSKDENKNGLGSVRRVSAFPYHAFKETVVAFEPNQLMEYVVSKGSPIKNHKGRIEFSDEQGKTRLNPNVAERFGPKALSSLYIRPSRNDCPFSRPHRMFNTLSSLKMVNRPLLTQSKSF